MSVTKMMWRVWQRLSRSHSPFPPVSGQQEDRFAQAEGKDDRQQRDGEHKALARENVRDFRAAAQGTPTASIETSWDSLALAYNRVDEKRERREDACSPTADEPNSLARQQAQ